MAAIGSALNNARTLLEVQRIAQKSKTMVSFWGKDLIVAEGYTGYLSPNAIARKLMQISGSIQQWTRENREECRVIAREVNRLNQEMSRSRWNSSFLTRIFWTIRRCFCRAKPINFEISQERESADITEKIIEALRAGAPFETIQNLFQQNHRIFVSKDMGKLLKTAASLGNTPVLTLSTSMWVHTYQDWGEALVLSIQVGCYPNVQLLAGPNARLLPFHFGQALKAAAIKEDGRYLRELLRRKPSIYERGAALCEALNHKAFANARLLLEGNPPLVDKDFHEAVQLAAKWNERGILEQLLGRGRLRPEDLGAAVKSTLDLETLRLLLAKGSISYEDRGMAAIAAARENNLDAIRLLQAHGYIQPSDLLKVHQILAEYRAHRV